jgi:hypothetical protein
MPTPFIDPSATSLRDAAFWVHVRQALYNSTISQEPLDIDFELELLPMPDLLVDTHPLAWLRRETAWANQILWITACVANFCFSGPKMTDSATTRAAAWQELWDKNQAWQKNRPKAFDPIGRGPAQDRRVFEEVWFTADWHGEFLICVHERWRCIDAEKSFPMFSTTLPASCFCVISPIRSSPHDGFNPRSLRPM